jgi:dienelactone hydrolase
VAIVEWLEPAEYEYHDVWGIGGIFKYCEEVAQGVWGVVGNMQQKVMFKNSKGQKLIGILDVPDDIESIQPCPAVIVAHGFTGFKEQPHIEKCAKELCGVGFVALRFDSSNGVGESDGDIFDCDLTGYLDDMTCALDFLETLSYVDNERLGLTGHSFGGQATLITAATDARVKAIVSQSGTFIAERSKTLTGAEEWKKRGYKLFPKTKRETEFKVSYHFCEDRFQYPGDRMRQIAASIKVPTMIIHSENDGSVPLDTGYELFDTLNCEKDMHVIKGAPHTFREQKHIDEVAGLVVEWFSRYLK